MPANIALLSAPVIFKVNPVKEADLVEIDVDQKDTSVILASIPTQKTYKNIDVQSTTDLIKKELKGISGVYAIAHNDSDKIYVGSSMDLSKRIMNHISNLRHGKHNIRNKLKKHT